MDTLLHMDTCIKVCVPLFVRWTNGSKNSNKYGRMHAVNRNKFARFIKTSVLNPKFHFVTTYSLPFHLRSIFNWHNDEWKLHVENRDDYRISPIQTHVGHIYVSLFVGMRLCVCVNRDESKWKWHRQQKLWPFNLSPINKNRRQFRGKFPECYLHWPKCSADKWQTETRNRPIINVIIIIRIFWRRTLRAILQKMAPNRFNEDSKKKENSFWVSLRIHTHTTKTEPNPKT